MAGDRRPRPVRIPDADERMDAVTATLDIRFARVMGQLHHVQDLADEVQHLARI